MSLAERQAMRQKYRDDAIAKAELAGMTERCRMLQDDMDNPDHYLCRGEEPGNGGCLCRHHDIAAATVVVSRKDERL